MTKKKTKTPQKSAQQVKRQAVLQRLARGRATRTANLAAKKAQAAALLASLPPSAQKAAGKMATKKRNAAATAPQGQAVAKKGTKRAKKGTVTDALRSRAATLASAIRSGRVPVRQGVTSPKDVTTQKTSRAKHQKFMAIYKGVRIPKKVEAKKPKVSKNPSAVYKLIPGQQSRQKFPYYLASGYTSRVGGGATGPGVVRVIPKTGATPFRSLDESKQREIVSFLNGDAGKALRGKGAKRKVTFQAIKQVIKAVRTGPGTAKKKQKASANYR